ncbi:MAG: hypothetical protein MRQ13_01850 [Candidatus Midichloria sp.]|nr:hypothetical protein [Candidatus Midichloria sp.]
MDKVVHHDGQSMIKKYYTHGGLQGGFRASHLELQEAMKNGEICEYSEYFLKITEWIEKGEDYFDKLGNGLIDSTLINYEPDFL